MSDLGELEDLYYAACAKLKERLDDINIRLSNGFIYPEDNYFCYNSEGLGITEPIKAGDWKATLLAHTAFLYDPLVEGIMTQAVFLKNKRIKEAQSAERLPLDGKYPGLRDVRNMSSGMIFGSLSEKYRVTVHQEELEKAQAANFQSAKSSAAEQLTASSKEKQNEVESVIIPSTNPDDYGSKAALSDKPVDSIKVDTLRSHGQQNIIHGNETSDCEVSKVQHYLKTTSLPQGYISPYNLNERAKKLNQPGGPEMPCICDPECMCAPLCAADPLQNCFCEENALFCRVTEGMDIDELSYPTKATEEAEAEKAAKEYLAQLMSMDNFERGESHISPTSGPDPTSDKLSEATKTYSTIEQNFAPEPYSSLEPVNVPVNPIDDMDIDHTIRSTHELLTNGETDYDAVLSNIKKGGSLSIWAEGSPNRISCNWHDTMRAEMEAQQQIAESNIDPHYSHFSPYGRLHVQQIHEKGAPRNQHVLSTVSGSRCGKRFPSRPTDTLSFPQSNMSSSGAGVKQGKPNSKASLFANRLIGRSARPILTAPSDRSGKNQTKTVNTSDALPRHFK